MKNKYRVLLLMLPLVLVLSGCGVPDAITQDPSGIWDWIVYILALMIVKLGHLFGENIGWGLVFSTLIVRCAMIPLYRTQIKSTESMNAMQPEMKKVQDKYKNVAKDDKEGQMKMQQEMSALYKRHGVNPLAGCLPLLIQMPILFAYYDAIRGLLINGRYMDPVMPDAQGLINLGGGDMSTIFLGFELADTVIFFAILAGLTTWFSTKLSMMGTPKTEGTASDITRSMLVVMPIMIFVMGLSLPGALSIYWVVGNIVTIGQTAFFKRDKIFNSRRAEVRK